MAIVPYREYVIKAVDADGSYSFNSKDGVITVAQYWLRFDNVQQRIRFDQLQTKPAPMEGETIAGRIEQTKDGAYKLNRKPPTQGQTANLELAEINAKLDRLEVMVREILAKL